MSGLFGLKYFTSSAVPDEALLRRSIASLGHRGPDAMVVQREAGLGMCHARLSVRAEHRAASKPFQDETGRFVLLLDGEIENQRSIASKFEGSFAGGCEPSSEQLILQGLVQHGSQWLSELAGPFAFAFADLQTGKLILARDKFGAKPLFWKTVQVAGEDALIFGSEIKGFEPWAELDPSASSLRDYVAGINGPDAPQSFFAGVSSVAAGTALEFGPEGVPNAVAFASLTDLLLGDCDPNDVRIDPKDAADRLESLLQVSIARQSEGGGSVGALCSGRLDTSLIAALAAKVDPQMPLFHANIKCGDSAYGPASRLAKLLGLEFIPVDVTERDFVDLLPDVVRHCELPFDRPSNAVPVLKLARAARERGVKTILSGEGSDELFAPRAFPAAQGPIENALSFMVACTEAIRTRTTGSRPESDPDRLGSLDIVATILKDPEAASVRHAVAEAHTRQGANALEFKTDGAAGMRVFRVLRQLPTRLLRRDAIASAAGIEARFPFVTDDIIRFAMRSGGMGPARGAFPGRFAQISFAGDKTVLRNLAERYLPKAMCRTRKPRAWANVYSRLGIHPRFFANSSLMDALRISDGQMRQLLEIMSPEERFRLMLCQIWTVIFLDKEEEDATFVRLKDHVRIYPQGRRTRPKWQATGDVRSPVAPFAQGFPH